jgi:hypothetical protein
VETRIETDPKACSGAIDSWGAVSIRGTTFTDNQAIGGAPDPGVDGGIGCGGAVGSGGGLAYSSLCTIQDCAFPHNQAIGPNAGSDNSGGLGIGGAVSSGYTYSSASITITGCSFSDNEAVGGNGGSGGWGCGGALNQESPFTGIATATATLVRCAFANNRALGHGAGGVTEGGAICNYDYNADDGSGASLMISGCSFTGNEALASPGGDGTGLGGGYAVGTGVLFGMPEDTSSVILDGGSVVNNNPDNAFRFWPPSSTTE